MSDRAGPGWVLAIWCGLTFAFGLIAAQASGMNVWWRERGIASLARPPGVGT